jgi:UDP-N-acetylmuramyl pentapeptide phosphotransferase/UDP-N-acetylglucosamine-1-phosphate transferase
MNFFDGVHGQASATSAIGFGTIWLLIKVVVLQMYTNILPDTLSVLSDVQTFAIIFGVMALIYAVVERKPRGLVRDAGTLIYGFVLAYLALAGGAKIGTILVVLSLVVFDMIRVIFNRIFVLRKPFRHGDFTHLHHRLLVHGRSKKEINIAMVLWSLVMMILMLLQGDNKRNKIIIFIMMATLFFGINAYIFRYKKKSA